MNTDLHQAAEQWVGVINGELVCHTGIIQFPMRKGWKRVHRLVVLPDYQGIGVGMNFISAVCAQYRGWKVNLTTTTPALVGALRKSKQWSLVRFGRVKNTLQQNIKKYYGLEADRVIPMTSSEKRVTYSFNYTHRIIDTSPPIEIRRIE